MRLKNKKTGEIVEVESLYLTQNQELQLTFTNEKNERKLYMTGKISTFENEWEDVPEEPKDYYFIRSESLTVGYSPISNTRSCKNRKEIGNYFETKEEAEKTVEKLKAWKRLKDKGFRFKLSPAVGSLDINPDKFQIEINADMPAKWFCCDAVQKDLDDCFGGEE